MSKSFTERSYLTENLRQFIEEMKPGMNAVIERVFPFQYKEQIGILTAMTNAIKNKDLASVLNENFPLTPELKELIIVKYKSILETYNSKKSYSTYGPWGKFDPEEYRKQGIEKLQEHLDEQITHLEKQQERIEKLAKITDDNVKLYDQTVQNFLDQDFESNEKQEFSQQIQRIYEAETKSIRSPRGPSQRLPVKDYIEKELPLRQEQWQQQRKKEYKLAG